MRILSALTMLLTLTCDQASRLLSESQEIPLNFTQRAALRFHLWICRSCRRYRRQLHFLRKLLRDSHETSQILEESLPGLTEAQRQRLEDIIRSS